MVELKHFVKKTLLDIATAVDEAANESPLAIGTSLKAGEYTPYIVNFDICVSTKKDVKGNANIINVLSAGGNSETNNASRISFNVPIYFNALQGPYAKIKRGLERMKS